jgi:hypothetical protein
MKKNLIALTIFIFCSYYAVKAQKNTNIHKATIQLEFPNYQFNQFKDILVNNYQHDTVEIFYDNKITLYKFKETVKYTYYSNKQNKQVLDSTSNKIFTHYLITGSNKNADILYTFSPENEVKRQMVKKDSVLKTNNVILNKHSFFNQNLNNWSFTILRFSKDIITNDYYQLDKISQKTDTLTIGYRTIRFTEDSNYHFLPFVLVDNLDYLNAGTRIKEVKISLNKNFNKENQIMIDDLYYKLSMQYNGITKDELIHKLFKEFETTYAVMQNK